MKQRHTSLRFLAAVGVLFAACCVPAIAANSIGEVVATQGSPQASGPGGSRTLQPGGDVFENDRIVTGDGNAQIRFVDDTKLVVGPNSTLFIDRFLLKGGDRAENLSLDALRGTFRFISGRSDKDAYEIKTANASIGIRGTAFDFSSRVLTLVAMFSGSTELSNSADSQILGPNCDVGLASADGVRLLQGTSAQALIEQNLPYITDQSSLVGEFKVDVSACSQKIKLNENETAPSPGIGTTTVIVGGGVIVFGGVAVWMATDHGSHSDQGVSP